MEIITEVKERPILFSTPMVRAILEGRKTVTRRVVKFPPDFDGETVYQNPPFGIKHQKTDSTVWRLASPYGIAGDILWVRETWADYNDGYSEENKHLRTPEPWYIYKADACLNMTNGIWKPSIHMPRKACRLRLEIQSIRVERLHDITEEDAIREGIGAGFQMNGGWPDYTRIKNGVCEVTQDDPRMSFATLWESINGAKSWIANPWTWRIEFKKL